MRQLGSGREVLVGRQRELGTCRGAVNQLAQGHGSVLWLAGESGIGKSSLLATAVVDAAERGYQVFAGTADELSQHSPLGILLSCLGVSHRAADPRRAEIAELLRSQPPIFEDSISVYAAAAEMLVGLVDELCVTAPVVLSIDEFHWLDDASMVVWQRLAKTAEQLPLLLIGAYNQDPKWPLGRGAPAGRRHEQTLHLAPLGEPEVSELLSALLGARPGPTLVRWAGAAMGNPLYVRELADVLRRENLIEIVDGQAEIDDAAPARVPPALTASLSGRLSLVPQFADALQAAALLGDEFAVTDLSILLDRPASALAGGLRSAEKARILTGSGQYMVFRHPLIRQALHDGIPLSLRTALHLDAAQKLAAARADPLSVAQQLLAAGRIEGQWISGWLAACAPSLVARAPATAARLLEQQVDRLLPGDPHRPALAVALASVLHAMGRWEDAVVRAREAIASVTEPAEHSAMYWLLIRSLNRRGKVEQATAMLRQALAVPELPELWRGRLLAALALNQRAGHGALDDADSTARDALASGERSGDAFATAYALTALTLISSVRRDHGAALRYVDQALDALDDSLGDRRSHPDLRMFALHCRIFVMQNLGRWADAEASLRRSRDVGRGAGYVAGAATGVTEAVLLYWLGNWDDALAELSSVAEDASSVSYAGLREGGPALLWRGLAALIALRREDRASADEHLRQAADIEINSIADRENRDFLLAAQAIRAEQDGNPRQAVSILSTVLDRMPGEMTLRYQWSADLVRLGQSVADEAAVSAALEASEAEAAAEKSLGRAGVMRLRCLGLAGHDPVPLRAAVAHYRAAGCRIELAAALEDLAVVLAVRGETGACRDAANEAIDLYHQIGASWDIRRTEARLRRRGIRRGTTGPRPPRPPRPLAGWAALTATERRVAMLVAEGRSTSDIAATMLLTRRTVQTHISRTLAKLSLRSRVEIAAEVLRHAAGPDGHRAAS